MKSHFGSKKGSLLLPVGVDTYVQGEACFWKPWLCLHVAEGLKFWTACKACMWHRRGEAGLDLSPVKWKGCETVQHWLCVKTQEYVASTVDGAKLPLPLWQIPFSSALAPFQTHWDGVCQLLQSGLDVGTYSVLKHFHSWQEAVKNKGVAGRGNVSPNWLAPWITEMPACQRVNHWSCLWCLLRSRTHQPAANVVFPLMCFLSFSLSFRPVHVHAGIFFHWMPAAAIPCGLIPSAITS